MNVNELNEVEYLMLEDMFKMFGSVPRLKVILRLSEGECDVSAITTACGLSQSATSHQLKDLKQNKIIKCRKVGLNNLYSLDDHHIVEIIKETIEHIRGEHCDD